MQRALTSGPITGSITILPSVASTMQPEGFQATLMANISAALLRNPSPPCLLRAPTGSGKTFVLGQVLQRVGAQREVLWFWFVPFVVTQGQLSLPPLSAKR